ncbi:hypothetical protein COCNU_scaffold179745G000010 [Cocos nucifera]|nr:hypothetical protein [Cocos nucifera]
MGPDQLGSVCFNPTFLSAPSPLPSLFESHKQDLSVYWRIPPCCAAASRMINGYVGSAKGNQ